MVLNSIYGHCESMLQLIGKASSQNTIITQKESEVVSIGLFSEKQNDSLLNNTIREQIISTKQPQHLHSPFVIVNASTLLSFFNKVAFFDFDYHSKTIASRILHIKSLKYDWRNNPQQKFFTLGDYL